MLNEKQEKEQEYLKNELYIETFQKQDEEFSVERVQGLVHLIEANEPTDLDEIEQAQKEFEAVLKKKMARKPVYRIRKFAQAAAVLCLVFIGANITTEAMFNESFLHMVQSWGDMYEIVPGDNEKKCNEFENYVFADVEEFAEFFKDDFLVCSWLPEGYTFAEILCVNIGDTNAYYWTYFGQGKSEIKIHIYDIKSNCVASIASSELEEGKRYTLDNNIIVTICENDDEFVGCFSYENYWYEVYAENKETLFFILEGMEKYE